MPYCDHLLELQLNPIQDTPTYFCNNQQCAAPLSHCCPVPPSQWEDPKSKKRCIYNSYLVNKWKHPYTISGSHFCICTQSLNAALFSFCDRFSSHSSTTREHCLCQRLESEVQEGHFTFELKMKQRHESSHCAKNCTRQEEQNGWSQKLLSS